MNDSSYTGRWLVIALISGFVGIIAASLYAERQTSFFSLRENLQRQRVPSAILSYGSMGKILRQLDLIQVLPNEYSFYDHPPSGSFRSTLPSIQKKSRIGIHLYGFDSITPEELPSSTIVASQALVSPTPLLSVVLDPYDLHNPSLGLLANPDEKGRNWERPAYISYFEGGELIFATGTGIRIHGGVSREAPKKSFRMYFKEIYGAGQVDSGILFDGTSGPLTRFVARSKYESGGLFVNSLAYDISRQIGARAPQTQPVRLFLNGEPQGVYLLTEHISEGYLRSNFGHEQFLLASTKSPRPPALGPRKVYDQFRDWAHSKTPLTMEEAAQKVDLDNFSRWLISVLFCSTPDALQGPVLLDLSVPDAKWFWINWDMDHSLVVTNLNAAPNAWEEDIFRRFYLSDARSALYHRLRLGSPEFRRYFTRLYAEIMNHRLTAEFLQERLEYYAALADTFGMDNTEFNADVAQFFTHRKSVLREQMNTYFDTGDSYFCRVDGPEDIRFEIDGYPEKSNYRGWYFAGMPIRVNIADAAGRSFSHWLINGEENRAEKVLHYPLEADTTIEAVFLPVQRVNVATN